MLIRNRRADGPTSPHSPIVAKMLFGGVMVFEAELQQPRQSQMRLRKMGVLQERYAEGFG